jgi:hypothetical protein
MTFTGAIFIIAADDIAIDRNHSTTEVYCVSMRRVWNIRRAPQIFQNALKGAPTSKELTQV